MFAQIVPNLVEAAKIWPNPVGCWPKWGRGSKSVELGPKVSKVGTTSTNIGPKSAKLGPESAKCREFTGAGRLLEESVGVGPCVQGGRGSPPSPLEFLDSVKVPIMLGILGMLEHS